MLSIKQLLIKAMHMLSWLSFQIFLWQAHDEQGLPDNLLVRATLTLHYLAAVCALCFALYSATSPTWLGGRAEIPTASQLLPYAGLLALLLEPAVHQVYVARLAFTCGANVLPSAHQLLHPREAFASWLPLDWLHGALQSAVREVSAGHSMFGVFS